jgi:hypothetical protein
MRILRRVLVAVLLLAIPVLAVADGCRQFTVMDAGTMRMCTQCCYHGQCQVTCL